jgi:RHS repeat-associated protein
LFFYNKSINHKLAQVTDVANDNTSTLGDFKYDPATKGATDYTYDVNGNLTLDNNKKISSITYNYLNLPSVITVTGKGNITYTYDASGNKLQKLTADNSTTGKTITTTTTYINGFVYESKTTAPADAANPDYTDVLQFTAHEEGRIRRKTDGTFAYDYFLKDHLGNVRMVLTDDQQTDIYPAATLEDSKLATEQSYYTINTGQIVYKSSATGIPDYANNNVIPNPPVNPPFDNANSAKVYVLNKNSQNTGLGITLRVMSGDKFDVYGKSYYFQNNTGGTAANTAVTTLNILTGFLGGPTGAATSVHGAVTATQLNDISGTTSLINALLSNQTTTNNATPQTPKAFINYILFDEQFKCVGSGFAPVGANSVLTDYASASALHNIPVTKNGFVYIYCSNESPVDVFFDNLQVVQTRGPILEETHYYPFGLTMAGISSQAAGSLENKRKFNKGSELQNKEFSDGSGLELYETPLRSLDPQLGRWWQIDSKPDYAESPYSSMGNNPILHNDPLGDTIIFALARNAAAGNGHMSLVFQNSKKEWFFFSQGASGNPSNSKMLSGSNTKGGVDITQLQIADKRKVTDANGNVSEQTFMRNPNSSEIAGLMKSGKTPYGADDITQMNTTTKQDAQISKNAFDIQGKFKKGESSYNLYFNNCVDGAQDAVQKNTGINLPIDFDPRPNSYFPKLKEYANWFNLPQAEKDKQADQLNKQIQEQLRREPKF